MQIHLPEGIFGATVSLGQPIIGDLDSIRRFGRIDLTAFHSRHYVADNLVLGICGPESHESLLSKLKPFADIKRGQANEIGVRAYKPRQKAAVIVDDDRSQCDCRLLSSHPRKKRRKRSTISPLEAST